MIVKTTQSYLDVIVPRILIKLLMVVVLCQVETSVASAQVGLGRPNSRPTFSPYLNLFRNQGGGGSNTLLNYYGLVRPQNEAYQQSQQVHQVLLNLQRQSQAQPVGNNTVGHRGGIPRYSQMGITGHPTAFMTYRSGSGGAASGGIEGGGGVGGGAGGLSIGGCVGYGHGTVTGHPVAFGAGADRSSSGFRH
jgi:hypothetical protein